jgi:hypothetical protein
MFCGKKVKEILPELACCEKEEMLAYHPFEKMLETYCPVHGGKIFNKDLDKILHVDLTSK